MLNYFYKLVYPEKEYTINDIIENYVDDIKKTMKDKGLFGENCKGEFCSHANCFIPEIEVGKPFLPGSLKANGEKMLKYHNFCFKLPNKLFSLHYNKYMQEFENSLSILKNDIMEFLINFYKHHGVIRYLHRFYITNFEIGDHKYKMMLNIGLFYTRSLCKDNNVFSCKQYNEDINFYSKHKQVPKLNNCMKDITFNCNICKKNINYKKFNIRYKQCKKCENIGETIKKMFYKELITIDTIISLNNEIKNYILNYQPPRSNNNINDLMEIFKSYKEYLNDEKHNNFIKSEIFNDFTAIEISYDEFVKKSYGLKLYDFLQRSSCDFRWYMRITNTIIYFYINNNNIDVKNKILRETICYNCRNAISNCPFNKLKNGNQCDNCAIKNSVFWSIVRVVEKTAVNVLSKTNDEIDDTYILKVVHAEIRKITVKDIQ